MESGQMLKVEGGINREGREGGKGIGGDEGRGTRDGGRGARGEGRGGLGCAFLTTDDTDIHRGIGLG